MLPAVRENAVSIVQSLEDHQQRGAGMSQNERKIWIALQYATIDHTSRSGSCVVDESHPYRELEFIQVTGPERIHGVLDHRDPPSVDFCPELFEIRMVERFPTYV